MPLLNRQSLRRPSGRGERSPAWSSGESRWQERGPFEAVAERRRASKGVVPRWTNGVGRRGLPTAAVGDEEPQVKLVLGDVREWSTIHRLTGPSEPKGRPLHPTRARSPDEESGDDPFGDMIYLLAAKPPFQTRTRRSRSLIGSCWQRVRGSWRWPCWCTDDVQASQARPAPPSAEPANPSPPSAPLFARRRTILPPARRSTVGGRPRENRWPCRRRGISVDRHRRRGCGGAGSGIPRIFLA